MRGEGKHALNRSFPPTIQAPILRHRVFPIGGENHNLLFGNDLQKNTTLGTPLALSILSRVERHSGRWIRGNLAGFPGFKVKSMDAFCSHLKQLG